MPVLLRGHFGLVRKAEQQRGRARHSVQTIDLAVRIGRLFAESRRFPRRTGQDEVAEAMARATALDMQPLIGRLHGGLAAMYRRGDKRDQSRFHSPAAAGDRNDPPSRRKSFDLCPGDVA